MPRLEGGNPLRTDGFNSFNRFLRDKFGEKVYRVTIDGGFSCPNVDGTVTTGGCVYCDNRSFSPNRRLPRVPIADQVQRGITFLSKYFECSKFIAYFQAATNTHGKIEKLERLYKEALNHPQVIFKKMKLSICSKSYKYIKIVDLYDFGKGVKTGIYGNATVFVTPPISEAAFGVILEDFKSKRTAYKNGGKDQKGAYELAYNLLIKTLDDLGLYVNPIANGDTAIIVLAGYVPTQTGSGSKSAPVIVQPVLSTTTIGVIDADCSSIPNAEFYGAILASQQLALTITHEGQITAARCQRAAPMCICS